MSRVGYGALSRTARDTIRWWLPEEGVTIAGYIRHWFPDGNWHGDTCGCPDDRCIGYHHDRPEDCHCLPETLGQYAQACRDQNTPVTPTVTPTGPGLDGR